MDMEVKRKYVLEAIDHNERYYQLASKNRDEWIAAGAPLRGRASDPVKFWQYQMDLCVEELIKMRDWLKANP